MLPKGTKRCSPDALSPPSKRPRISRSSSKGCVDGPSPRAASEERPEKRQLIEALNARSPAQFREKFFASISAQLEYQPPSKTPAATGAADSYHLNPTRVEELSTLDLNACFDLIAKTSSDDYAAASAGWNPEFKKEEMRTKNMWYILIRSSTAEDNGSDDPSLAGFLSFLIDLEEDVPVVYIYEVHLVREARGSGLGTHLMKVVHEIASLVGMDKSMLTCFTRNEKAERLYRRLGYDEDEISPRPVTKRLRRGKTVVQRPEFIILSRPADAKVEAGDEH